MIIAPETPITDASFNKWRAHRMEFEEGEESFYYYIIPLIDIDESELDNIEAIPALFSSESDEFQDENGNSVFTMRLFDEDMPELTSEEEIEILYKILTKKELFLK